MSDKDVKRPKGITIFAILSVLDAIIMAIFIAIFFGVPELYSGFFDTQVELGQEYAILQFNDAILELGVLVIVIDITVTVALLSSKTTGRKIVIVCAMSGIIFNVVIFGIPRLISNSILVWYMFRTNTKKYFEIHNL